MNKTSTELKHSPLLETFKSLGVLFSRSGEWSIPYIHSSEGNEYKALRDGVGVIDRSHWGRLRIAGKDALDLLNRLSTNLLVDLEPDKAINTVLTTNKGRIIDLLLVVNLGKDLIVITSPETPEKVVEWLDFYTFDEDISVENTVSDSIMFSVMGPLSNQLIESIGAKELKSFESCLTTLGGQDVILIRSDSFGIPVYDIVAASKDAQILWDTLKNAGAEPVGENALERLRIENGIPKHGHEIGEDFNPIEAGFLSSISFDKGCYVGQEVVLRLKTYDKVQKSLKHITIPSGRATKGSSLEFEGKEVGIITSVVNSPDASEELALGYIRNAYSENGQTLEVKDGSETLLVSVADIVKNQNQSF
jgi:folate-binding protein YgfZ